MTVFRKIKVSLTKAQKKKLITSTRVRLTHKQLDEMKNESGEHEIYLTPRQFERIKKSHGKTKGMLLGMSKTQIRHNLKYGGSIWDSSDDQTGWGSGLRKGGGGKEDFEEDFPDARPPPHILYPHGPPGGPPTHPQPRPAAPGGPVVRRRGGSFKPIGGGGIFDSMPPPFYYNPNLPYYKLKAAQQPLPPLTGGSFKPIGAGIKRRRTKGGAVIPPFY